MRQATVAAISSGVRPSGYKAKAGCHPRTRLMDMFLREHATILWVVEGEKYLRVHPPGIVYFYDEDPHGFGN